MSKLENQTIYECDICHDIAVSARKCTNEQSNDLPKDWNNWRGLNLCPKCSKAVGIAIILLIGKEKAD